MAQQFVSRLVGAGGWLLSVTPALLYGVHRILIQFALLALIHRWRRSIGQSLVLAKIFLLVRITIAQTPPPHASDVPLHEFFIDCSGGSGNGSFAHPWNTLADAQTHLFSAGDQISMRRGTVCHGEFAPLGSGTVGAPIRLTAYGEGPRPRIIATSTDRQALLLSNQEYWQVDSLDLSGGNTYGIFVTGDRGVLRHIYLKNLSVHDVQGGAMKNKDNGLVVVGPSKLGVWFEDVLIDGVDASHTNQWAGILVGGGPFYIPEGAYINQHAIIRNSTVHDVYGDGIVLFRDAQSSIVSSVAWETGMQPTQTIGTPNAIWTWTCTDCTVQDNEAFLTDSPGVDGGAFDIDWANTRNVVERNFAHDTQGYCFAVFAAGYVTSNSTIRDNLCVDNALSPRLAALQGAVYISTWNGGVIRDLRIEHNRIVWNPTLASAAAIVSTATTDGSPIIFTRNRIEASAPVIYRTGSQFAPSANTYESSCNEPLRFSVSSITDATFKELQSANFENGSKIVGDRAQPALEKQIRLEATVGFALNADHLLAPDTRAQLVVLRSLARQYGPDALSVTVHLRKREESGQGREDNANAILDLDAAPILFDENAQPEDAIRLYSADGREIQSWSGFQNAATLGGAVREFLGPPRYSDMPGESPLKEVR
jgi:hypothetical protein